MREFQLDQGVSVGHFPIHRVFNKNFHFSRKIDEMHGKGIQLGRKKNFMPKK